MKVFLDSSAFTKRYIVESGSGKVAALIEQADDLAASIICLPELISSFSRLVREKLSKANYLKLKDNALADLADVGICQITPDVLASTAKLLESNPLRAMDAIHIACAHAVEADVFVSADHRQLAAARKFGLKIVDVS